MSRNLWQMPSPYNLTDNFSGKIIAAAVIVIATAIIFSMYEMAVEGDLGTLNGCGPNEKAITGYSHGHYVHLCVEK
jgi:hypothetical protein